jgi:formate--tetrahydrofolate ligase
VPDAVVVVATVRALKSHGGVPLGSLGSEDLAALESGIPNLLRHVENITDVYGLPAVVAINRFPADTEAELELVRASCERQGVDVVLSEVWEKGGEGGSVLAEKVIELCDADAGNFKFAYGLDGTIEERLGELARRIYRADGVILTKDARAQAVRLTELGFGALPICVAKTQYSFSDDPGKLGAPENFSITVRELKVSAGAGFIVALTGAIMTMPGLPKEPAAERIDVDSDGRISGLF